ncbi:MAG TPA: DUF1905 domain-containing protein [Candidatus Binatia bacterium]|nr:DUF1905 domain-containing protein [Candidatus Binatia bacterium]
MANQIFPVRSPPSVVVTIIGVPFVVFIAVGTALSFRRERNLMSEEMRFTATLGARPRRGVSIDLPFDPDTTWGAKDRHYVTGSIEHYGLRGVLTPSRGEHVLQLGPAWCRDPRVGPGARVSVVLRPEGPQTGSMARDIAAALEAGRRVR